MRSRPSAAPQVARADGPTSCTPTRLEPAPAQAGDYPACRRACRRRHIKARIARRGIESSQRLGRHRWVVERTLAWLNRFRRLTIRYERRDDIHEAFLALGCAVICFNQLQWFC